MNDTSSIIGQRYKERLMCLPPQERLKMASRMYDSGKKLVVSGILKGRQHLDTLQLRTQLFIQMYGCDFTASDKEKILKRIPDIQPGKDM